MGATSPQAAEPAGVVATWLPVQFVHDAEPGELAYEPAAHAVHDPALAALKYPGGQVWQPGAAAPEKVPALHCVQVVEPEEVLA